MRNDASISSVLGLDEAIDKGIEVILNEDSLSIVATKASNNQNQPTWEEENTDSTIESNDNFGQSAWDQIDEGDSIFYRENGKGIMIIRYLEGVEYSITVFSKESDNKKLLESESNIRKEDKFHF